jgi:transposase
MPATVSSCSEHEKDPVDGGSDDRSGPAQGVAYRGGDRPGRGAARRHPGPGVGVAGGAAAGVGGGLAGPDLGGRGRRRLGNLLAQQLVAAGEVVLDVQPKVAARVRLLASGNSNKNDPNDARSVAVAALRSPARRPVTAENHTAVLKVWSKRYRDLGRTRTQVACRLHAVLADLVPGGFGREITAGQAAGLLQRTEPSNAIARARCELAAEFLADLRRLDAQIRDTRSRLAAEVRESGSTLTGIFGVGPVIAAAILGAVGDVARFGDRDRFAACNGTAPIEVSSGERKIHRLSLRGNRLARTVARCWAVSTWRRWPWGGGGRLGARPSLWTGR